MTEKKDKLTPKQQRFVSEYLRLGNATQAAKEAGYSEKTAFRIGTENLQKPAIARAIERAQARRNDRLELEEDFELKKAIEIMKMCMEPKQVYDMKGRPVKDEDGNYVMMFDSKGANMALQTIAKIRGKFVQKVQVGFADSLAEQLEDVGE
jgi:phage terminase small subunit|nr:MAG TPA: Terminase small subunit [Caudoviricetes sp.]